MNNKITNTNVVFCSRDMLESADAFSRGTRGEGTGCPPSIVQKSRSTGSPSFLFFHHQSAEIMVAAPWRRWVICRRREREGEGITTKEQLDFYAHKTVHQRKQGISKLLHRTCYILCNYGEEYFTLAWNYQTVLRAATWGQEGWAGKTTRVQKMRNVQGNVDLRVCCQLDIQTQCPLPSLFQIPSNNRTFTSFS